MLRVLCGAGIPRRSEDSSEGYLSDNKPDLVALMEYLAKALVDAPDKVTVEPFEEGGATVLELIVDENEVGRVIGRHGRTARSLRAILHAASLRTRKRYQLEIVE